MCVFFIVYHLLLISQYHACLSDLDETGSKRFYIIIAGLLLDERLLEVDFQEFKLKLVFGVLMESCSSLTEGLCIKSVISLKSW